MSEVKSHTDVKVGDKIVVTMIDGEVLETPHYATVTDIYAGQFDFSPSSIHGETIFLDEVLASRYDEWEYASEDFEKHREEEAAVLNRDVKVGDKILVSKVNHEDLESLHLVTVTEVDDEFDGGIGIYPPINGEDTLFKTEDQGDEWRVLAENPWNDEEETLQHRQTHAYYDDEAVIPTYSQFLESGRGRSLADYTGVNITEESLDFEPKEEEVLRGITAESLNFEEAPKSDAVNHPSHYNRYSREVIESIKGLCTPEEFRGYLKGNIIKYSARYSGKDGLQDIDKLAKYTQFLKEFEIEMEDED